ncbi:MAG: 50S ribosomal protein L19 [Patescibacteria group bacterium]
MTSPILQRQSASYIKSRPEIRQGYTVRVHEKIQEGGKERVQVLEGLVIAVHKGLAPTDSTFTVRRIASGIGVERVFSLHSPTIVKIEVKKVAKVRRAKLFFLRGRRGKAARLSERFTTAEEFAIAVQSEDQGEDKKEEQEVLEEKPGESNDESEDNAGLEEKTSTKEQSSPAADPKPEKSQQENDSNEEDEKSHEEDEKKEA